MTYADAGVEIFAVTADKGIRAWGVGPAAAFRQAGRALWSLMIGPAAVARRHMTPVTVEAADQEAMLVSWLNELLYLYEAKGVIGADCTTLSLTATHLDAEVWGETVDITRHAVQPRPTTPRSARRSSTRRHAFTLRA